jgi:hypothetical protein
MEPEAQLVVDLLNLAEQWVEMGIDPDSFVACGSCGGLFAFVLTEEEIAAGELRVCRCEAEDPEKETPTRPMPVRPPET